MRRAERLQWHVDSEQRVWDKMGRVRLRWGGGGVCVI